MNHIHKDSAKKQPEAAANPREHACLSPDRHDGQKRKRANDHRQFEGKKWYETGNQDTRGNGSHRPDKRVLHEETRL